MLAAVAQEQARPAFIVTFEPNPKLFFQKEFSLLQTPAQRLSTLRTSGVDGIFVVDFQKAHALSGEEFIRSFLIERFKLKHLVVGEDFRLGKGRSFSMEMLQQYLAHHQISCTVVKQLFWKDEPISSSRIREAIRQGKVEEAAAMLGRNYSIEGVVVRGDGIGSRIGYPTINIRTDNSLLPKGVYISEVRFPHSNTQVWGVTNVGVRPTLSGNEERVETYLLHFQGSMYGHDVSISFVKRLRSEVQFENTKQLSMQIARDVEALHAYLQIYEMPDE